MKIRAIESMGVAGNFEKLARSFETLQSILYFERYLRPVVWSTDARRQLSAAKLKGAVSNRDA